jgi:SnoaL-like domain
MYRLMKATGTILWSFALLLESCQPDRGTSANEQAARAMFAAFNAHDWKKMSSYYSEKAQFLDPSLGKDFVAQTREQIIEKYSGLQSFFPDIKDELTGVYPCDDKVIVEFTSTGNSGDSIRLQLPIVSILTFSGGLITKDATYYDLENP